MKLLKRLIEKLERANEEQFGDNKKLDCCDLNQENKQKIPPKTSNKKRMSKKTKY